MKALIYKNKVVDLVEAKFPVSPEMEWMDAPDNCRKGWLLENDKLVAPPEPPEPTYDVKRYNEYPSIGEQLDMMMKDKRDGTTTHQTACEAVKAKFPKPE
jgi:hypothetical protein